MTHPKPIAWFLALENDFSAATGGVQLCTREYEEMIKACGFTVERRLFCPDQRPVAKLRRRINRRPYPEIVSPEFYSELFAAFAAKPPDVIFFNRVNLAPLALRLRKEFFTGRFVLLSHGLMIMDELHDEVNICRPKWLGKILLEEKIHRKAFDLVFTLTDEECALEKWLGAAETCWIPRTVELNSLDWKPVDGRVGFVGTLDHSPTKQALDKVLVELTRAKLSPHFQLNIVGKPESLGRNFEATYPFVRYLGPLSDTDLRGEAATWCCFAHPLFAFARGCSTKLAVALGWELPILATQSGLRGYRWGEGFVRLSSNANDFAKKLISMSHVESAFGAREEVRIVARSVPTKEAIALEAASALQRIGVL